MTLKVRVAFGLRLGIGQLLWTYIHVYTYAVCAHPQKEHACEARMESSGATQPIKHTHTSLFKTPEDEVDRWVWGHRIEV